MKERENLIEALDTHREGLIKQVEFLQARIDRMSDEINELMRAA